MAKDQGKKIVLKNCIAFFSALLCVTLLITWSMSYQEPTIDTYKVVCMGDSIVGNMQDHTSITGVMQEKLGYPVFNAGFGGTCMANTNDSIIKTNMQDVLSMNSLAISMCNRNFGIQAASIEALDGSNYLYYFYATYEVLRDLDYSTVEVMFIEQGVNDYLAGTPIDNPEDPYDPYSFGGAIRSTVQMLQKQYPDMRIILVTPTYAVYPDHNGTCEDLDFGGGTLDDYVEFELELAKELGVEIIDDYHNSGINEETYTQYVYDGMHLNEEGRKLLGTIWAAYLLEEEHEGGN